MPKNDVTVTINDQEVQYIECCDCGLVHEVSYDIEGDRVLIYFERKDERTEKARIKRVGGRGKLFCMQLDEAIAREPVRLDISYKEYS